MTRERELSPISKTVLIAGVSLLIWAGFWLVMAYVVLPWMR